MRGREGQVSQERFLGGCFGEHGDEFGGKRLGTVKVLGKLGDWDVDAVAGVGWSSGRCGFKVGALRFVAVMVRGAVEQSKGFLETTGGRASFRGQTEVPSGKRGEKNLSAFWNDTKGKGRDRGVGDDPRLGPLSASAYQ